MLHVEKVIVGPLEVNCWIIWNEQKKAIIIDPGYDADKILKVINDNQLSIAAYMMTHGHADHISALADIANQIPAELGIHPADAKWAFSMQNIIPPFYSYPKTPTMISRNFSDNQIYCDADITYKIIETPGHTPGSVCFYFENDGIIFTGDTLFKGSAGRTDFPGGNPRKLTESLKKLKELPDNTIVHSGHGPSSTIGYEKEHNFFMRHC